MDDSAATQSDEGRGAASTRLADGPAPAAELPRQRGERQARPPREDLEMIAVADRLDEWSTLLSHKAHALRATSATSSLRPGAVDAAALAAALQTTPTRRIAAVTTGVPPADTLLDSAQTTWDSVADPGDRNVTMRLAARAEAIAALCRARARMERREAARRRTPAAPGTPVPGGASRPVAAQRGARLHVVPPLTDPGSAG
jgi:hypothetical protein